jgi:transcriptional regulator with XRE-family HTH domain
LAFAIRVAGAFKAFNTSRPKADELSQAKLGEIVGRSLGQDEAIKQASVSRWMSETNPSIPDTRTIEAIAAALETDPSWLAFGHQCAIDSGDQLLSKEQVEAAHRVTERKRLADQTKAGGKR